MGAARAGVRARGWFLPDSVNEFLRSDAAVVVGLAGLVALGVYVARWWAVAVVLVPLAFLLGPELGGYATPFETADPLDGWPVLALLVALPVAVGVGVRALLRRGAVSRSG